MTYIETFLYPFIGACVSAAFCPDDDECFHFDNDGVPMDLKAEAA